MLSSAITMAFWAALAVWPLLAVHAERACPGDAGDGSWCYSVPDNWIANTSLVIQLDGNIPTSGVIIAVHKVSQFPNGSINHEPIATWTPFPSDPLVVTWIVNQTIGSSMHAHFTVGSDPKVTSATHVVMDSDGNTGATTTFTVATGFATSTASGAPTAGAAHSDNGSSGGVSIGMVVGIVAAGIGLLLLIAGIWLYHRRAVKKAAKKAQNEMRDSEARFGPKYAPNDERPDYMSYDSYGSQYSGHGPSAQHMSSIQPYPTSLTHAALAVNASQHSGIGNRTPEPSEQLSDRTSHLPVPNNIQYQHPQQIPPGLSPPVSDPRYSTVSGGSSANDHIAALTTSVTNSVLQQLASLHLANQRNTMASLGTVYEDGASQGAGSATGGRRGSSQPLSPVTAAEDNPNHAAPSPPRSPTGPTARAPTDTSDVLPVGAAGNEKGGYLGMHVTNPNDDMESIQPSTSQEPSRLQAPNRAMSVTSVSTAPPLYRER